MVATIRDVDSVADNKRWICAGFEECVCPSVIVERVFLYAIGGRKSLWQCTAVEKVM
ncbi:hypothetical protein [Aporhodopirellula aestuarii]|uniref:Uncharacterized protein n=1 Tax=Aporhodopirellula aestuarii TaxID=2950107 RepID=A0ABT0U3N9_9BACT|nr:hypothetical protein [Aporhodopirellula aestuarii]MCM2371507.1 hypothetical protein [Aporhodopirellula aestuarii]